MTFYSPELPNRRTVVRVQTRSPRRHRWREVEPRTEDLHPWTRSGSARSPAKADEAFLPKSGPSLRTVSLRRRPAAKADRLQAELEAPKTRTERRRRGAATRGRPRTASCCFRMRERMALPRAFRASDADAIALRP